MLDDRPGARDLNAAAVAARVEHGVIGQQLADARKVPAGDGLA
jgi:hypothetical protein